MLRLDHITVGYGKQAVLRDLSLVIARGMLISIIGPNGCGKSTLLKATIGHIPLASGEITLDGRSLSVLSRTDIAKAAAYLAQGKAMPDMTVGQMVLHGRFPHLSYPRRYAARDREIARAAMMRAGVDAFAEKPLAELSGGMRQSAYLAMALAQDTPYILLDEPTTYLDVAHGVGLMRLLKVLAGEGRGIVAVMHDLPLAFAFSDCIAVMNEGRIEAVGTPEEICKSDIVERIFGVALCRDANGEYTHQLSKMK